MTHDFVSRLEGGAATVSARGAAAVVGGLAFALRQQWATGGLCAACNPRRRAFSALVGRAASHLGTPTDAEDVEAATAALTRLLPDEDALSRLYGLRFPFAL